MTDKFLLTIQRAIFSLIFLGMSGVSFLAHSAPANEQLSDYLPLLKEKRVGLVANAGSIVGDDHLLDILLRRNIKVTKLFSLEHGFRSNADAGEIISNTIDHESGLPILSLYGKTKKPSAKMLEGLDVIVFDIQDVGVRFFTFISSLGLIMEAASENGVEVIVLDRANPNGDYIGGPVLDMKYKSFVGAYPIPIVYGLTIGELALMIKGESWVKGTDELKLKVVKMKEYKRDEIDFGFLKSKRPSPNLPSALSIRLYPSLALFEGTIMSLGRGTLSPFEAIGHPSKKYGRYVFTPKSIKGMAKNPKHKEKACYGDDLSHLESNLKGTQFTLSYLNKFLKASASKRKLINNLKFFRLLLGRGDLYSSIKRKFLLKSKHLKQIEDYKKLRQKYLIYNN